MTAKKSTRKAAGKPAGGVPKVGASRSKAGAKKPAAAPKAPAKDPQKVAAGKASAAKRAGEKTEGSGRKAGTPNRRTVELMDALHAAGYDPEQDNPIVWMFKVYTGELTMPVATVIDKETGEREIEDVPLEPALRVKCMSEVAQYLFPKRKAVEVTGKDGEVLKVYFLNLGELEASGVGVVSADQE